MELNISPAEEKDFEEIDRLINEITGSIVSVGNKWRNYKVDSESKKRFDIFKQIIKNSNDHVIIAKLDDEIVGCVNFQVVCNIRHGWMRGHLEEVVVKEGFRNRGIGTEMLNYIKSYCKDNDIKVVKLMCGKQLEDSYNFYLKNGFKDLDHGLRCEIM